MNREQYNSDSRYRKVLEQMDLLGIMDITTTRQAKNGTVVWKLPIKNNWPGNRKNATYIEVASFKTGYVRNQNSGYSNYQLNKRKFDDEYFQAYEWKNDKQVKIPSQYRKWSRKTCVLIPIEIDRLEYLISYCLKNYYIKHANFVANGEYIPKWTHEWELKQVTTELTEERNMLSDKLDSRHVNDCGHYDRITELEDKLENMTKSKDYYQNHYLNIREFDDETKKKYLEIRDLENKLDTIKRIADYE